MECVDMRASRRDLVSLGEALAHALRRSVGERKRQHARGWNAHGERCRHALGERGGLPATDCGEHHDRLVGARGDPSLRLCELHTHPLARQMIPVASRETE